MMRALIVLATVALIYPFSAIARGGGHSGHGHHGEGHSRYGSSPGEHYVSGYLTKRGTYVQGHMQTNPNGTSLDNWSTKGNVNPYTGKWGTKNPVSESTTRSSGSYEATPHTLSSSREFSDEINGRADVGASEDAVELPTESFAIPACTKTEKEIAILAKEKGYIYHPACR